MIQLAPQLKILLAVTPTDLRKGIDGLAAVCRQQLVQDPFSGTLFIIRNAAGTSLRMLCYDGSGFWLLQKRFSEGRLRWWPRSVDEPLHPLAAHELAVLLFNGRRDAAQFPQPWRRLQLAGEAPPSPGSPGTSTEATPPRSFAPGPHSARPP
jgi:transposase